MNSKDFLLAIQEELEIETKLNLDTDLKQLDEWDSMTAMLLIGYVSNEFNVTLTADDLKDITTVNSLVERIGKDNFN
jgi:acyl carrier protein